jgi:pimeloyl-ACP methyl ester carboxylesterase
VSKISIEVRKEAALLSLDHIHQHKGQRVAWGRMGQGEPIVLVHGTPFSSQVWRKIAPLLARGRSVYFYDLLGYGQSEMRAGQDVSLGIQNDLLADLIARWGLDRPEVLCHDFGGATVLRAYYLNGLRYRRLTVIDAVALAPWGSPFVRHVGKHEAAFAGLPAHAHEALLRAYLQGAAFHPLSREALRIYMAPWQGEVGQAAFYRQIAQMDQKYTDEIESQYRPMDGSVQILWGEKDDWIPVERGQRLADLLTAGKLEKVPDAGHLVQEDAPETIIAAILA